MEYWKLRIDTEDRDAVEELCNRYFSQWLYAFEKGSFDDENPHCHFYFSTLKKEAAIRMYIRKTFGRGNRVYSMKNLDEQYPIAYLAYCMKQGSFKIHDVPDDVLDEAKNYDNKIKNEMKEKKESKKTQLQKLMKVIEDLMDADGLDDGKWWTLERVSDIVIDFYKDNEILIREFMLVSLIQTLALKYVNGYDYKFRTKLMERIL